MVPRKNLLLCLASVAILATAILGTCFVAMAVRAAPAELTDLQKIYNFLIQGGGSPYKTNAERLEIDAEDASTWTVAKGFFYSGDRLTHINFENRGLYGSLDLSNFTALTSLSIQKNNLTALNLSDCTALSYLSCENNKLSKLDVSQNIKLTELWCRGNQFTELKVSNNTQLNALYCDSNKLTELDVRNNAKLLYLSCAGNQLKELDLSNNPILTTLQCYGNQINELDVSNNTVLAYLYCYGNPLTKLNVSGCTKMSLLYWKSGVEGLNLTLSTNQLHGYLANNTVSSFVLFPYVDVASGKTYARASVGGYELNIKFDAPFTIPPYIYATIAINESTGKIDFNTHVQTSYSFYGCTSDDGTVTDIIRQAGGGWEKFTGTFNNNSMNVTLHYNPLGAGEHGITYYNDKGQPHTNPTTYLEGETITLDPLVETDTYTFEGWFDAPEGGEKVTVIPETANEDIVLWARWTAKNFTITYNSTTGDNPNPETYTCEDGTIYLVNLDDTDEYKFEGWFDAPEGGNRIESFDSDEIGGKVFYAQWSEKIGTTDPGTDPTDPGGNGGGTKPGKPNIYLWGGIGLLILALLLALIIYLGVRRYGKKKESNLSRLSGK